MQVIDSPNTRSSESGTMTAKLHSVDVPDEPIIFDDCSEIDRYRSAVETLMRVHSDKVITNSLPHHAAVLFEMFFKHAHKTVRIFCRNLNAEVFGNPCVVRAAKDAINRGVIVRILIQEDRPQESAFTEMLKTCAGPVLVKQAERLAQRQSPFNFAIRDANSIRYEEDREQCKAWAIMHTPHFAEMLCTAFDGMFGKVVEKTRSQNILTA